MCEFRSGLSTACCQKAKTVFFYDKIFAEVDLDVIARYVLIAFGIHSILPFILPLDRKDIGNTITIAFGSMSPPGRHAR